jgi:arginine exporter protein ArgO
MWDVLWSGILAGYGIAIPVGAIAVLIINTSIRCGFMCGAAAGAGAATADLLYASVAATAGAAASRFLAPWESPTRWVSGLVLMGLAAKGLYDARTPAPARATTLVVRRAELALTYGRFLGLTVINPMTVIYFGTVVIGANIGRTLTVAQAAVFAGAAFAASLSWQLFIAALGARAGKSLPPGFQKVTTVVGNLFIALVAVGILI